jgi:hypothetical protein
MDPPVHFLGVDGITIARYHYQRGQWIKFSAVQCWVFKIPGAGILRTLAPSCQNMPMFTSKSVEIQSRTAIASLQKHHGALSEPRCQCRVPITRNHLTMSRKIVIKFCVP